MIGKLKETVILGGQPTATLPVKAVRFLYLLVPDDSIGQIMNVYAFIKKLHFQHAVKTAHRGVIHHRIVKQGIFKGHPRTYQSRRHSQIDMSQTEYGIVYLLADCIQICHTGIQILGHTMCLYHPDAGHGESIVQLGQVGRSNNVIRIYYQCYVVSGFIQISEGCLQGFGIGALLKIDLKQLYGK